jgi:acetyl-CoA carboxylase biotin carboxyl carrier protein
LDLKQIKQVIDLMKRSDLSEFEVEDDKFKLRIRRNVGNPPTVQAAPAGEASAPPRQVFGSWVAEPAEG